MEMPVLRPRPIVTTSGENDTFFQKLTMFFVKHWRWIISVREWELIENWDYELPDGQKIVVPRGFVFDGASIPRLLWSVLSPAGLLLVPGLVHDFAYRYTYLWAYDEQGGLFKLDSGEGRRQWDVLFFRVGMKVNDMFLINLVSGLMLALFGGFAWSKNRKKDIPEIFPEEKATVEKVN